MRFWPFKRKSARVKSLGPDKDLEKLARTLVERSALGEQNATAHLVVLGEKYRARANLNPKDRAQVERSYTAVMRAAQNRPENPTTRTGIHLPPPGSRADDPDAGSSLPLPAQHALATLAGFGCDEQGVSALSSLPGLGGLPGVTCAIVLLAAGPLLSPDAFLRAKASLPPGDAQDSFQKSADDPFSPPKDEFGFAGFVVSRAARLQAVRRGAPFALLGETMAWELGE